MLQKQLKSRAIAVNEDLPRKMLFSISVCRWTYRVIITGVSARKSVS